MSIEANNSTASYLVFWETGFAISDLLAVALMRQEAMSAQPLTPSHRYLWLYIIVLKGFLVYISDIFTAVTMLSTDSWSNAIFNSCSPELHNGCVAIPFNIGKWLFFGCIIASFLLVSLADLRAIHKKI